jgi:hypothetical protein
MLYPPMFKDIVAGQVALEDIRRVDDLWNVVYSARALYVQACAARKSDKNDGGHSTGQHKDFGRGVRGGSAPMSKAMTSSASGKTTGGGGVVVRALRDEGCLHCHAKDHLVRACPKASEEQKKKAIASLHKRFEEKTKKPVPAVRVLTSERSPNTSGSAVIGGVEVLPFAWDSGATHSVISASVAERVEASGGGMRVALSSPFTMRTASGAGDVLVTHEMQTHLRLTSNAGVEADLPDFNVLVVEGLAEGELLLGKPAMEYAGYDEEALVRTLAKAPNVRRAILVQDSDKMPVHVPYDLTQISVEETSDALPPEINEHDPVRVKEVLEQALKRAAEAGLSERAVARLQEHVLGPVFDMFRLVMANDPPARMPAIRVEVLPGIHGVKQRQRK